MLKETNKKPLREEWFFIYKLLAKINNLCFA